MNLRLLELKDRLDISEELGRLKVHPDGIKILSPKAVLRIIKIQGFDSAALNILKQEMLSIGGDCAVSWDSFIKRTRNSVGIIMGTVSQITRLCEKLDRQPLGLPRLADKIRELDKNLAGKPVLNAGRFKLDLSRRTLIMGILNVTPDSFSDGGIYFKTDKALLRALKMEEEGADIIDIGGESTRPGARPVTVREECERVIPLVKLLAKRVKIPISIDTSKSEVARKALDCGAVLVNDVSGLRKDSRISRLAAEYKAAVVIMHMRGTPRTMHKVSVYNSLMDEVIEGLEKGIGIARNTGISDNRIIIDPGIGFAKTAEQNLEILKRLREFKSLGYPILVGLSRKSFIGRILDKEPQGRLFGTAASAAIAIQNGAGILRVHDVGEMKDVARITDAILNV